MSGMLKKFMNSAHESRIFLKNQKSQTEKPKGLGQDIGNRKAEFHLLRLECEKFPKYAHTGCASIEKFE